MISYAFLLVCLHCFLIFEFLSLEDKSNYHKDLGHLGFQYTEETDIVSQEIINLLLSTGVLLFGILVFKNVPEDPSPKTGREQTTREKDSDLLDEIKHEDQQQIRKLRTQELDDQEPIESILGDMTTDQKQIEAYESFKTSEKIAYAIWAFFIFQIITADGLIGVLVTVLLTPWVLFRLHSEHNSEKLHQNRLFFLISQIYSLIVCFLSLLFNLGVVKNHYENNSSVNFILIMNGFSYEIKWLEITQYIVWAFILVMSVYAQNILEIIDTPQKESWLMEAQDYIEETFKDTLLTKFYMWIGQNHFGLIIIFSIQIILAIPSLVTVMILLFLFYGIFKDREKHLNVAILVNYFSLIFLTLVLLFNVPINSNSFQHMSLIRLLGFRTFDKMSLTLEDRLQTRATQLSIYILGVIGCYAITHLAQHYNMKIKKTEKQYQQEMAKLVEKEMPTDIMYNAQENVLGDLYPVEEGQHLSPQQEPELMSNRKSELDHPHERPEQVDDEISVRGTNQKTDRQRQTMRSTLGGHHQGWSGFMNQLFATLIVHVEKVVITYLFIEALARINILHAVFLFFFIWLCFSPTEKWRRIMKYILGYSLILIFAGLIVSLLVINGFIGQNDVLTFIGLTTNIKMFECECYTEYYTDIIIFFILLYIQVNWVYKTFHYKVHKNLMILLLKGDLSENKKTQVYKKLNYFSQVFVSYGIWFCYFSLLIIGLMPPANYLSLTFLLFLQGFISVSLIQRDEHQGFMQIMKLWPTLVFLNLVILIMRYLFLYDKVSANLSNESLSDFGLSSYLNIYQLIGNGLSLLLLNRQRRLVAANISEVVKDIRETRAIIKKENAYVFAGHHFNTFSYKMYKAKIHILMFLYQHISKLVLLFGIILAVMHSSILGIIQLLVLGIAIFIQRKENWVNVWFPLWVLSFLFFLCQYLFQLVVFSSMVNIQTQRWMGVHDINERSYWIFIILYIFQQLLCLMMRKIYDWKEEGIHWESYQSFVENRKKIKDEYIILRNEIEKSTEQKKNWEHHEQYTSYSRYLRWDPFYRASQSNKQLKEFIKYYGFELLLFISVLIAFGENNIYSLLILLICGIFAIYSYLINDETKYNQQKLDTLQMFWRVFYILFGLEVLRKYLVFVWFPVHWNVIKPWNKYNFNCDRRGMYSFSSINLMDDESDFVKCQKEWRMWLSLEDNYAQELAWDMVNYFLFAIFDQILTEIKEQGGPKRINYDIKSEDLRDFTLFQNRKRITDYIKFFFFTYFYVVAIIIYFIIGALKGVSIYSDLISSIYLFLGIYLLIYSKHLLSQKANLWKYLTRFNSFVLLLICLYQSPIFQCPIIYPTDRYYLSSQECLSFQEVNTDNQTPYIIEHLRQNNEEISGISNMYIIASHALGFNKSEKFVLGFQKLTLMVLFFFFGLLQVNIWTHPFTKHYIESYFVRERIQEKSNAIDLVEKYHLSRYWSAKMLDYDREVYENLHKRVNSKVKLWDNVLEGQSKPQEGIKKESIRINVNEDDQNQNLLRSVRHRKPEGQIEEIEESKLQDIEFQNVEEEEDEFAVLRQKEEIEMKAQAIVLEKKNEALVRLKDVIKAIKESNGNEGILELQLKQLKLEEQMRALEEIYQIPEIGLEKYVQDMTEAINIQQNAIEHQLQTFIQANQDEVKRDNPSLGQKKISNSEQSQVDRSDIESIGQIQAVSPNNPNQSNQINIENIEMAEDKKEDFKDQRDSDAPQIKVEQEKEVSVYIQQKESEVSGAYSMATPSEDQLLDQKAQPSEKAHSSDESSDYEFQRQTREKLELEEKKADISNINDAQKMNLLDFMVSQEEQEKQQQLIQDQSLSIAILMWMQSYFSIICMLSFIICACHNADLVSIVYPLSYFMYALIEYPYSPRSYWRAMTVYAVIVISVKFIYQLPFFCGTPAYSFLSEGCDEYEISHEDLSTRIDFIIGIQKYSGPSSYPRDVGFFIGILFDYIVLLCILAQRYVMTINGQWRYVYLSKDENHVPQFREPVNQEENSVTLNSEQKDIQEKEKLIAQDDIRSMGHESAQHSVESNASSKISANKRPNPFMLFFKRLFPSYQEPVQHEKLLFENMNKNQVVLKESQFEKEGADYYTHSFIVCIITLVYFLIFFPFMVRKSNKLGERQTTFSVEIIFVLILILFILIFDRVLYKINNGSNKTVNFKHTILLKLVLHISIIVFVHYYLIFYIPHQTMRPFYESITLIFAYIIICFYFYFSALQIQYGYPPYSMGEAFTDKTGPVNKISFKVYRALPFLYELKCIIDWTVTKTSLDLFQWFKLEDASGTLYATKAEMDMRRNQHTFGQKRPFLDKCYLGFAFAIFLILILILPILLFSSLNPAVQLNNVTSGSFQVYLDVKNVLREQRIKIFTQETIDITYISDEQFMLMKETYYGIEDDWKERIQKCYIDIYSDSLFYLSRPNSNQLKENLKNQESQLYLDINWVFKRPKPEERDQTTGSQYIELSEAFKNKLRDIIHGDEESKMSAFKVPNLLPFMIYAADGTKTYPQSFEPKKKKNSILENHQQYSSAQLSLTLDRRELYWKLERDSSGSLDMFFNTEKRKRVTFFILNDFVFSSIFASLNDNLSVIGIYITVVFAIGRFLRLSFDQLSQRVIYEEMPNTNDLFDLCQSIYIARIEGNLKQEELYYELLIRILRSPQLLLRLTGTSRYKEIGKDIN